MIPEIRPTAAVRQPEIEQHGVDLTSFDLGASRAKRLSDRDAEPVGYKKLSQCLARAGLVFNDQHGWLEVLLAGSFAKSSTNSVHPGRLLKRSEASCATQSRDRWKDQAPCRSPSSSKTVRRCEQRSRLQSPIHCHARTDWGPCPSKPHLSLRRRRSDRVVE
jgi:hypothetical protein